MVEMAFWDLWARSLSLPLQTVLGGEGDAIDMGVSLGVSWVCRGCVVGDRPGGRHFGPYRRASGSGVQTDQHQILPGHDLVLVRAAREAFAQAQLTVDANCPYTLADTAVLAELGRFDLDCIEQTLVWDDIHDHATLQPRLKTPVCLDECIKTAAHARKAMSTRPCRQVRHGWYTSLALRHATLRCNIRTGWRYCHRRRACICARVKWYQRDWCLQCGIDLVRWTYEPLMQGINAGLPSDRLLAEWHLRSVHVAVHAAGQLSVAGPGNRAGIRPKIACTGACGIKMGRG